MDKVKIGGIVYSVEIKEDLVGHTGNWGETNLKKTTIALDSNMSKQRTDQTLVHEIVHGIFEEAGFEQDEDKVNRLGIVLYQVLQDNDFSFLRDERIINTKHGPYVVDEQLLDEFRKTNHERLSRRLKGEIL